MYISLSFKSTLYFVINPWYHPNSARMEHRGITASDSKNSSGTNTENQHIPRNIHDLSEILLETNLIIDTTTSEPRDVLMTERTALTWVKFSMTLAAISLTIVTNFRLDTSNKNSIRPPYWFPQFSYGISILFVILSMVTLFIGAGLYAQSIYNYKNHSVSTYSLKLALGFLFFIGLVLLAVNIVFMIAVGGSF